MTFLTETFLEIPVWAWIMFAVLWFGLRPSLVVCLPDDVCGSGGWLIDTDEGKGWFGFSDGLCDSDGSTSCDGGGDGGD